MIIQAELKCKQTGCEADPCAVDIPLRYGAVPDFGTDTHCAGGGL